MFDLENMRGFRPLAPVRVAFNAAQSTVFDVQHTPGRMARPLKTDFCVTSGKNDGSASGLPAGTVKSTRTPESVISTRSPGC